MMLLLARTIRSLSACNRTSSYLHYYYQNNTSIKKAGLVSTLSFTTSSSFTSRCLSSSSSSSRSSNSSLETPVDAIDLILPNKEEEKLDEDGEWAGCTKRFLKPLSINSRGSDILTNPLYNKGTAFKLGERDRLRFRGLLPPRRLNLNIQKQRILQQLREETSTIKQNRILEELHDRNETLYHRILVDHIEEMAPLVYTPTVGQACREFAYWYRRPRGMYFCQEDRGHMAAMTYNCRQDDIHIICVTDGSRILGLGDLGANGMGIPIGKLSLYCAAGGVAPHRVLPVVLDVGTNNQELIQDPFYVGVKTPRLQGQEYYELVDEFMQAVQHRWPGVLIQFEDFSSDKAQILLNKYRHEYLCFNDDIQGTGATTLAGILSALRARGESVEDLCKQRILIAGAGSAGIGVAQVLKEAMIQQSGGSLSEDDACKAFYIADQHGLLHTDRLSELSKEQAMFARHEPNTNGMSLLDIMKTYKPTILLGLTAVGGLFTEELIKEMSQHCKRPIIFPLSNPTTKAECTAEQAYEWSNNTCIFASGSPFDPVLLNDGKTYRNVSQCNNMFIFPGLGLGAALCGAKTITDEMLYVSAKALAKFLTTDELSNGQVFPSVSRIRDVSHQVACAVIHEAHKQNIQTKLTDKELDNLEDYVQSKMYDPIYVPLVEKRTIQI